MLVMAGCGLLLAIGLAYAYRWRSYTCALPDWAARAPRAADRVWLQLVWLCTVGILTGLATGALVIGPGGRLVMRLLAATSPDAKGFRTDAGETVGRISLNGTIGFIVFVGLAFGVAAGLTYVFASFGLPRGVVGGILFGLGLLVVFGSRLDPLRADNPDFTIVGPGGLSIASFTALAIVTGGTIAPFAGRIATALPAPRLRWVWWLVPAWLFTLVVLIQVPVSFVVPVVGSLVFWVASTNLGWRERLRRRGRAVLGLALTMVVLVSVPGFISAVDDIVSAP